MKIEYCDHTGLLFVNKVAIAAEMLAYINNIIVYDPQFNCSVIINDIVNEASVTIGKEELDEIDKYILTDNLTLASDSDFEHINFNFNLN